MTDMTLLLVGAVVFGLMLTGMVLTILEFRQISKNDSSEVKPNDTHTS